MLSLPPDKNTNTNYKWDVLTVWFPLQEPTDSLEETLLLSQPDFSLGTENGSEEGDNPSGTNTENPVNHSPDNARVYHFLQLLIILKEIHLFALAKV